MYRRTSGRNCNERRARLVADRTRRIGGARHWRHRLRDRRSWRGTSVHRAWLCAYVFWLGLPLGAVTLVLVHDLTGGAWMASARPVLAAAATTMPVATLSGIPVLL